MDRENPRYYIRPDVTNARSERQVPQVTPVEAALEPRKNRKFTFFVIALLMIVSVVTAGYFYYQYSNLKNQVQANSAEEVNTLVASVGRLMVLPQDETPTVATVTEPERLKDQPFFANAQKGYKVLIYTKAKKAILYDPETNRIVEVAPVNISENATSNSTSNN